MQVWWSVQHIMFYKCLCDACLLLMVVPCSKNYWGAQGIGRLSWWLHWKKLGQSCGGTRILPHFHAHRGGNSLLFVTENTKYIWCFVFFLISTWLNPYLNVLLEVLCDGIRDQPCSSHPDVERPMLILNGRVRFMCGILTRNFGFCLLANAGIRFLDTCILQQMLLCSVRVRFVCKICV